MLEILLIIGLMSFGFALLGVISDYIIPWTIRLYKELK